MKKKCSFCKEEKEFSQFYKDKTKKFGIGNRCKKCSKEYRDKNKKKYNLLSKQNREKNKEKYKEYSKKYYQENKEYFTEYSKNYREQNKDKIKKYRESRKEITNQQLSAKRKNDSLFKLKETLRNRIYTMFKFKNWNKSKTTEEILGADYNTVKNHIENTFIEGMAWENHGEWHIDHKIPLNSAKTEKELLNLCHYTNLQALWAFDNLSKSDKL